MSSLPQHYDQFDLRLAWGTKTTGTEILIEGLVKNVRYLRVDDLEIWVAVLDAQGRTVARSVGYIIPPALALDEIAPFSLKLPVPALPGTKLRFTYLYAAFEGDGHHELKWTQSFDAEVPAK